MAANEATPKKKPVTANNPNTYTNMRRVAKALLKERFPELRNGLEAANKLRELALNYDERELIAAAFYTTASSPAISEFIADWER